MGWNAFTRSGTPAQPDSAAVAFAEINTRLDRIFVRFDRLQADFISIMDGVQAVAINQQRLDQDIADLRVKVEANATAIAAFGTAG